ncbi:MAG: ABC transporter permease [Acidobacteria bacterium]|nr:ABC transporter permease [Acidobacteriota bacterium]
MDSFRQDIRYAIRRLLRNPGFTAIAVLTLALGIGANSAIFSVVNGVLLKPLPYHEPDRLVAIYHTSDLAQRAPMSGPNFTDVRRLSETLTDAAAISRVRVVLTGEGEPVRLESARVSASLFDLLGVRAAEGRTFTPEENEPGRTGVAILEYGFWQQRFGGDRSVVGRRILLNGVPTEVIGVMPKGFSYPSGRSIWTPLEYTDAVLREQRGAWYLMAVGRAKPGVRIDQVTAEIQTIGRQLAAEYPDSNEGVGISAESLHETTVGDIRKAVLVLLGAVGFVLLIACANVANLLLARAAVRETEMAVRVALGAGRIRLVRQLLTESVILAAAGAGLGLLLAVWGVDVLKGLQPAGIPRLDNVGVDATVMWFTAGLAVVTGLVFGVVPAIQASGSAIAGTLKEGGRGNLSTRGGARMRGALVVAEMALAVMLLAGAGLLIRSFSNLAAVDPGFSVTDALTFELSLPADPYGEPRQIGFFEDLIPRLEAIPGVETAGAVLSLPLTAGSVVFSFEVEGRPPVPPSQQPILHVRVATPGYFPAIGIPLQRGRFFTAHDRAGTTPVVVITEAAARQHFPGEDPIGKRIELGWGRAGTDRLAGGEVVGVVGDVKDRGLSEPDPAQIYLPYAQWPVSGMSVVLKTSVPPRSVTEAARAALHAVDPALPIANVRTMEEIVSLSISQPRFYMTLLSVFAAVALILAAIGIFGVLSYAVAQRTREIGIRMALGAQGRTVLTLVVRQAMLLALSGVAIGLVCAFFLSRTLVTTLLFSTNPQDPMTFVSVAALLTFVALAASYIPARRATRVDPIVALRGD